MLKLQEIWRKSVQNSELIKNVAKNLDRHLRAHLPKNEFSETSMYGVLPPGKLFRPMLAANTFAHYRGLDELQIEISNPKSSLSYFCSALEIHHAYTLMHDDLPCMDDDDVRRGKQAAHIKFGEWQALLAADGLINVSYSLLSKMQAPKSQKILQLATWSLGPRGLILGQALDLSEQMNNSFQKLIWTHQLKTGRLIQLSIIGAALLAENSDITEYKKLRRFSEALGIAFQLIDDLTELWDEDLSEHEKDVNPWLHSMDKTLERTLEELLKIESDLSLVKNLALSNYFEHITKKIANNNETVAHHLKTHSKLAPVVAALKRLSHF